MNPVVLVLVEILIVIGLSRIVGLACRWVNQPLVIGEIIAGIMLGPSLFGLVAPGLAAAVFSPETIPYLNVLSQVGLIFFMFLIGLELDPKYLKNNLDVAILTSNVSIIVPFSLAIVLSLWLYPLVSNASVSFTAFALFLGSALSITAFPVLARIITENNLQGTRLGTLALTCAAVDDVTAWCLLALSIAVTRTNSMAGAVPTIIASLVYIGLMLTAGRWFLQRVATVYERNGRLTQLMLAGIYAGVVASALITELIGIHLIFGAFLLGAVMPKNPGLVRELAQKTEDFVLIFLLPIFFAYSGLRTQIGLLDKAELWGICLAILLMAIAGKYVGTYFAARASGIDKREASALGWLMNTRGLTELIVLNIGLSLGVISPLLFTMLVIMALVTTFMTSPLLEWTYPKKLIQLDVLEAVNPQEIPSTDLSGSGSQNPQVTNSLIRTYNILVPVANPSTQKGLLQLAVAIAGTKLQPAIIHPLSLIELQDDYLFESMPMEAERVIAERHLRLEELIQSLEPPEVRALVHPIIKISNNIAQETAQIAALDRTDLILAGSHRPAFSQNLLGGRVGQILNTAPADVAVLINRAVELGEAAIQDYENLLVPYSGNIHDDLSLELALRLLIKRDRRHLTILRIAANGQPAQELSYEAGALIAKLPSTVRSRIEMRLIEAEDPIQAAIEASARADLTLAGMSRYWGIERQTLGRYTDELATRCQSPLLITRRYSQVTSHLASVLAKEEQNSNLQTLT